ncbi:MAG TPA: glycosyltransferase [Thermoflexales bacterium]|nr:glycosyltransferase [Thermoflexales bacterium]HQW36420.1 glycosyltransferase [Thermoflexales bacterium]HQZ20784.1 glycosyltransferase [Thermoflexales bacterium]
MRIAFISMHTSPLATLGGKDTGGMNVFVREAARALAHRGHKVDIFTRSNGSHSLRIDPRIAPDARVIHVPAGPEAPVPKNDLYALVPAFTEWMCEFAGKNNLQYDVIHAHYWLSGLVADALRECWGTKFVQTFHTLAELKNQIAERPEDRESELRLQNECHLCDRADLITANTSVERTQLIRFYGAGSRRIRIVPPGVDTSRFHPIDQDYAKSVIGIPPEHKMVLFAGRIEPLKGTDSLLRAVAVLRERHARGELSWDFDKMCVSIIGGDPSEEGQRQNAEMARLFALRESLGLKDLVVFLGARDQDALHFYYSAADCLVMPSHYESFGMVALEAMACGTPVIASDVGGLSQLVQHNKTGIRVPVKSPVKLADAMDHLLGDEVVRRRMGHAAACYAEDFDWNKIVDKLLAIYGEIGRA